MDDNLRKLHQLELDMMLEIDKICKENNLIYYLMGGTLIGAVRHKGFIPWDDDIDLGMPRPDYEKFLKIAPQAFSQEYGILTPYNSKKYKFTFTKVINKKMRLLYKNSRNENKWNIWIDIFPLDSMPENRVHFLLRKYYLLYRRGMVMLSAFDDVVSQEKKKRPLYERLLMFAGKHIDFSRILNTNKEIIKFDKALKKYDFKKGPYMVNAMGLYKFKTVFERAVYGKPTFLEFEGHMLRVPEQYDYFLKRLYGDYMKLPPENKRDHHKIEFVD